jgi:thiamine monophosphate synthase
LILAYFFSIKLAIRSETKVAIFSDIRNAITLSKNVIHIPYDVKNNAVNIGKTTIIGRTIGNRKKLLNFDPACLDFLN